MSATYFDIQERIEEAKGLLAVARVSQEVNEVIDACWLLLNLIAELNEKDAPQ